MNSLKSIGLAFSVVLLTAAAGWADPVTLRLVNVGPGNNDGSYYVYPYNFSINGSQSLTSLICDDFKDDIYLGESWTANRYTVHDILSGQGQMSPSNGLVTNGDRDRTYEDAAWLYQQLVANPTAANAISINHTIWGLFTNTPYNANPDVTSWFSQAQTATADLSPLQAESLFANVVFYTPVDGTQPSSYGRPQEMIGYQVPAPASLALFGTGLLGLVIRKRRKV